MGGRFGRKKKTAVNPYFSQPFDPYNPGLLPPNPYEPGYDPYGGLGEYDPYDVYGYGYPPTESFGSLGGPFGRGPYGGRYSRGFSQMSGTSPWNYGNFYMGNTTIQMIPHMQRKLAKFSQRQGMSPQGGFGMPMMPCLPAPCAIPCAIPCAMPCAMPCAAPMVAAATPLPIACNPLVQGMYPMAGISSPNWMTPSSFMSAFTSGPLPYRPPASFEFPNNISMVMPFPAGASNPLLSMPSFGGFNPQFNFNGGLSCCCTFCAPSCAPPPVSFYPRPVSVPQPYPVPYPTPVPIPNIQQVPVPRPVTVVAPPIFASGNESFSIPAGAPLMPSQGGLTQSGFNQQLVMASNENSTSSPLLKDEPKRRPPVRKSVDQVRRANAQRLAASLSNLGLKNSFPTKTSPSRLKYRLKSTRPISNYDLLSSDSLFSPKRSRKSIHRH